jgi:site-specific DNA-methyltransferase (adenine-specific)
MGSIDENVGTYGTGLLNTRKAADQRGYSNIIYAATDNPGDRFRIAQPAMKPIYLMQWLVRLVTPTGGTVLDPFAGTGATAEAALREGCSCILIAEDEDHRNGIRRRFAAGDAD